ncbi:TPA: phage tail terminator family protein [Enterococcus faecium]
MKSKIVHAVTKKLKEIVTNATIYEDSVMQSIKDFYFILSVMHAGVENAGVDIQNKEFLVDIALIDNKSDKKMVEEVVSQCEAFFNVIEIDGNQIFPEDYMPDETDGIQHIRFTLGFPQYIEWSEK